MLTVETAENAEKTITFSGDLGVLCGKTLP
jgi:hypothetical protein